MPVEVGRDKTTISKDPNDAIPKFGTAPGEKVAENSYEVGNGAELTLLPFGGLIGTALNVGLYSKYAFFDSHTKYFDSAQKSANILNKFWDRAIK